MASQYNGLGGNIALHSSFNISASTNATPIQITTTTPHDFSEGDLVFVSGHAVNTNANGIAYAHVVDGSNVRLYGLISTSGGLSLPIAGNGIGATTGTIRGVGLMPTFQIPSDGDSVTAASVNVGLEAGADAYQNLASLHGSHRIVYTMNKNANGLSSGTAAPVQYGPGVAQDTTWRRQALNVGATLIDFFDGGAFPYPMVQNNDVVDLIFSVADFDTTVAGHGSLYVALATEFFEVGTAPTTAINGAVTSGKLQGSATLLQNNLLMPLVTHEQFKVTGLPRPQLMQVYIAARTVSGINSGYAFNDDVLWTCRIVRPTGLVPVV